MPGEPVVRPDEQYPPNRKHPEDWMAWTRTFGANLSYNDLSFSIRFYEYTTPPSMEDELRLHREEVIQRFRFRYSRETPLTTYGVPAVELAFEYDRIRGIDDRLRGLTPGTDLRMGVERLIIPNNGVINIQVVGKELDTTSPLVRRFLNSFKLFPPTSPRRP